MAKRPEDIEQGLVGYGGDTLGLPHQVSISAPEAPTVPTTLPLVDYILI